MSAIFSWKKFRSGMGGIVDFLYPPYCIHCSSSLHYGEKILCVPCTRLLELISVSERCHRCFSFKDSSHATCIQCQGAYSPFVALAAAVEYSGVAETLIHALKYRSASYLAKSCAAYIAMQYEVLGWSGIEGIIPVPQSWMHRLIRGYNQSELLARELGALLRLPVICPLQRVSGDFSQSRLCRSQRQMLSRESILLKMGSSLQEKIAGRCFLLVDDVLTTGKTLSTCTSVLQSAGADDLYGITFCHSIHA